MRPSQERIVRLLHDWATHAERYWYPLPGDPTLGCYGTGYNSWGVQTNQKYLAAMAALGVLGERLGLIGGEPAAWARERALAALRFSLHSHVSGEVRCTDGTPWGHTWISALGVERLMFGVYLLEPWLGEADRTALKRVLCSECDWLLTDYCRESRKGIVADPWNHTGKNAPESNLWNGAILWRTAVTYPDHPHAGAWQEQAHRFLVNSVSVPADAEDRRLIAGRAVGEWCVGANFFPNYALDHHGYLNVGYMVICLSNGALLHFDMRAKGLPVPESLYHHHRDLWQVVRHFVFSNGRLARIGGDSRVRYTYCQEYLLPTLAYAADAWGDEHALGLLEGQLGWIEQEAAYNDEGEEEQRGSFYGRRLAPLTQASPYYYTRLESDRAGALGMALAFLEQLGPARGAQPTQSGGADFERSVAGLWCEPEHGAVLHRSPSRLASFAWRAHGLAQGMCQPPDDGHLAEWSQHLGGLVRFLGDDGIVEGGQARHRKLVGYSIEPFDGGFVTSGTVTEGVDVVLAEGWRGSESAIHRIAFVALPDGHTVVGLEHCRTVDHRTYVAEVKGMHLNLPNDLFNGFVRRLDTARGEVVLPSPPEKDQEIELGSRWATIEGRLGAVGLYGAASLVVHRSCRRRGGPYRSLYVDEICFPCALGTRAVDPRMALLDVGWAVLSSVDREQARRFAENSVVVELDPARDGQRTVRVQGLDGRLYLVMAHFGQADQVCPAAALLGQASSARDLVTGETITRLEGSVSIRAGQARVFALEQ